MNRCKRCDAPLPDGADYCPSRQWREKGIGVRFYGCVALSEPVKRPYNAGRARSKDKWREPPSELEFIEKYAGSFRIYPFAYADSLLEDLPIYSGVWQVKYLSGSVWTNERYGWSWARYSWRLRQIALELRIALVGLRAPTLVMADAIENALQGVSS